MMNNLLKLLSKLTGQPSRRKKAEILARKLEEQGFVSEWNEGEQKVTLAHPDGTTHSFYFGQESE